jgi:hypothetical protein
MSFGGPDRRRYLGGSVLARPKHCILMPPALMLGHDSSISALMKGTERVGRALRLLPTH